MSTIYSALPLPHALALAESRRAVRLALIQSDLDDLRDAGIAVTVTAEQLQLLEDAGLLYDFDTGLCGEAPRPRRLDSPPLPSVHLTGEIARRMANWRRIQAGLAAGDHIAQADAAARVQTYIECGNLLWASPKAKEVV